MPPPDLQRAARVIRQGGIVAYATEYCYGLGCDPLNHNAVVRLLRIKHRPAAKGLILIAAGTGQLDPFVRAIPSKVLKHWPGPFTWLLDPSSKTPAWIMGNHRRIAVRVTAHPQAAALCRTAKTALVSTSANRAHERPARSYREVLRRLGGDVDYVLPGAVGNAPMPTPIRDACTGELVRGG